MTENDGNEDKLVFSHRWFFSKEQYAPDGQSATVIQKATSNQAERHHSRRKNKKKSAEVGMSSCLWYRKEGLSMSGRQKGTWNESDTNIIFYSIFRNGSLMSSKILHKYYLPFHIYHWFFPGGECSNLSIAINVSYSLIYSSQYLCEIIIVNVSMNFKVRKVMSYDLSHINR